MGLASMVRCNKKFSFLAANTQDVLGERLGYVRNPRSLMEGTETLCRDDIGDLPGSPNHLWLRENANEIG